MSVIKTQTKTVAAVVISQFHLNLAKIATHGQRAVQTVAAKTQMLILAKYGDPKPVGEAGKPAPVGSTGPTFAQYKADLKALDQIAKDRGLSDGQWLRRPYGAALKSIYGALPESQDAAAVLKRTQREARDKIVKDALAKAKADQTMVAVSNPVGAPAGETQERAPSAAEVMEQTIARLGVWETLYACLRILDAEEATKPSVIHLRKMADKAKDASAKATAAARVAAITPTVPAVTA